MHRFWQSIIEPILDHGKAQHLVEVGCSEGLNTKHLLLYCRKHGARLSIIDTKVPVDLPIWQELYGDLLTFHEGKSLDVLPTIKTYDAILLDGDHNWYTVYNELSLIASREKNSALPLILLHDTGWPYARRDMYYDPESIPEEYRQPYRKGGVLPGHSSLVPDGFNSHFFHATQEGTPRNGILTAVEDFLLQTPQTLSLYTVPGCHGIGILADPSLLHRRAGLEKFLSSLQNTALLAHAGEVEQDRLRAIVQAHRVKTELNQVIIHLQQTLSWRLTSPLRNMDRGIRSLPQKIASAMNSTRALTTRFILVIQHWVRHGSLTLKTQHRSPASEVDVSAHLHGSPRTRSRPTEDVAR